MSTTAPFTPPKKKPSVFWWIGGVFLLLVFVFIFQLFGPSPRIIVSPQTTYITTPLRPDGLPDYERSILERCREGVTAQNNAAALLWPAIWPGELSPKHYAAVAAELGLDAIPSQEDAAVPVSKFISNWSKSQGEASTDDGSGGPQDESEFDRVFGQVTSRPWASADHPWLAKWVNDNQKPLDAMVKASRRPRCYFPSPTLLDNQSDPVVSFLLPGVQTARECGRSLIVRAMWHVGEHHPTEAWLDLLAIHRIGRLVTQGPTLVEQLVGIAIDNIACQGTITLLHDGQLTLEQARQILRDVSALPSFSGFADSVDHIERLFFLDLVVQLKRGSYDAESFGMSPNELRGLPLLRHFRINWNTVLIKGNKLYDRLAAAGRLSTFEARQQAIAQVEQDIHQLTRALDAGTVVASVVNASARSDAVASILLGWCMPAFNAAFTAQDRANAKLSLLRLAAALAVYRAEKGSYPEKLDGLIPGVLEQLPVDLYHAKPFFYRRIDDGYLLYTAGPNGQDDGGSNEQQSISQGYELDAIKESRGEGEAARPMIPSGADDFSIRVPPPSLKGAESKTR